MTLRLEALDPAVWALTLEAVAASKHDDRCLRVVCRECGRALAWAGVTKKGPLFTSSWVTEIEHDEDMVLDARRLRPGERRLALEAAGAEIEAEGPSMDQGRDGVVALLALPVGMAPDYPDLLVRCDEHGDAVLDRAETLDRVRGARSAWKTTAPATASTPPRSSPGPTSRPSRQASASGAGSPDDVQARSERLTSSDGCGEPPMSSSWPAVPAPAIYVLG